MTTTALEIEMNNSIDPLDYIGWDMTNVEDLFDDELLDDYEVLPTIVAKLNERISSVSSEIAKRGINPLETQTDDALADRRKDIAEEIGVLQRQEETLKAERDSIDQEFMARFEDRGTEGTKTTRFTLSLIIDDAYPIVDDRTSFEDHILRTGDLHLLQNRPAIKALKEELAIKITERAAYEQRLQDSNWDSTTCEDILRELSDSNIDDRLAVLKLIDKGLQTATKGMLEEKFSIPGISFKKTKTLRQIKRGNKV